MKVLLDKVKNYLKEILSLDILILPWKEQTKLPLFLNNTYAFFETSLLNNPCLFVIPKDNNELTPHAIQKHWEQIAKIWNARCIYVSREITNYNRKKLIETHISFIIPNNQIYLPDLGIDLREHFKQQRINKSFFSPSTQIVIISVLLSEKMERLIPSELATKLDYSPMTMTRAFNELDDAGVGNLMKKGKERWWIFENSKQNLWEQTNNMLRSPIRRRESMKILPGAKMPQLPMAGMSALAETTMISPPSLSIYAMGVEEYNQINTQKGLYLSHIDEADFELEIWNYNPKLFSKAGIVDPISLYLSLRETKDERVEKALEELMETIEW